jgi:hypothetical protein
MHESCTRDVLPFNTHVLGVQYLVALWHSLALQKTIDTLRDYLTDFLPLN